MSPLLAWEYGEEGLTQCPCSLSAGGRPPWQFPANCIKASLCAEPPHPQHWRELEKATGCQDAEGPPEGVGLAESTVSVGSQFRTTQCSSQVCLAPESCHAPLCLPHHFSLCHKMSAQP